MFNTLVSHYFAAIDAHDYPAQCNLLFEIAAIKRDLSVSMYLKTDLPSSHPAMVSRDNYIVRGGKADLTIKQLGHDRETKPYVRPNRPSKKPKSIDAWRRQNYLPDAAIPHVRPTEIEVLPVRQHEAPSKLSIRPSKALKLARKGISFDVVRGKAVTFDNGNRSRDFGRVQSCMSKLIAAAEIKVHNTANEAPLAQQLVALVRHDTKLMKSAENALAAGKVAYANRLLDKVRENRTRANQIVVSLNDKGVTLGHIPYVSGASLMPTK